MLRVTTLVIIAFITVQVEASYSLYSGGPGLYSNYHGEYAASYDNYIPKPYAFEYGVSDPHTGDHKNQWETKDTAGVVRGSYSLLEPDGSTRIVDYIADKGGFRAVVKRINIHGYASVESHGGAVEAPTVHGLGQIIVAEPSPVQPVALSQPEELVVKQPAVYIDQGQIFESYDGGYQNYQNLVPYQVQIPRANGIAIEQPRQEIGYAQQAVFTPQSDTIYTQQQAPYVIPVPPRIQETYQHSSNPLRNELSYQQPQQIYQESPPVYQAPIQRYEEPQIENVAIPAYRENTPIDNYQLEMIYGAQGNAYTSDSLGSQANTILHPHGQSSQTFSGSTGNLADDTVYTNYPQNNLNQAQYISTQGTYEGRYKRKS